MEKCKAIIIQANEYEAIRNAISCVEEQLEVLAEGMSNQWNVDGYLDQQGIDDAIVWKERTVMDLNALLQRIDA